MRYRLIVILALLLTAGCGGNRAGVPLSGAPQQDVTRLNVRGVSIAPELTPTRQAGPTMPTDALLPTTPPAANPIPSFSLNLGTPLPEMPVETGSPAEISARRASAVHQADLSTPYEEKNATPAPGMVTLDAPSGDISYAIYRFSLAPGEGAHSILVDGQMTNEANGAQSGVYVGLANYTQNRWQFFAPTTLAAPFAHTLIGPASYQSPLLRNVYVVVLTWNEDAAEVIEITLNTTTQQPSWFPTSFGDALGAIGLGEDDLGFNRLFLNGGEEFEYGELTFANANTEDLRTMLPTFFDAWYKNAGDFPQYIETKGEELQNASDLQDLLLEAVIEFPADKRITRQDHEVTLHPTAPLANAVATYVSAVGGTPDIPAYTAALAALDLNDQRAIAPILYAMTDAYNLRQTALSNMGIDDTSLEVLFNWSHGRWVSSQSYVQLIFDTSGGNFFLRGFDYAPFFTGSALILNTIDDLRDYIDTNNPTFASVNLTVDTPAGRIVIAGTGNDLHEAAPDGHAFLLDLGGNDTYDCHAGGTASPANGIAVCLDLEGNDTYNRLDDPDDVIRADDNPSNDHTSQQGAGRFGIGILVDFAGIDTYESVRLSQGCAIFGVGFLADLGNGGDTYNFEALGQGGAYGGIGILFDEGGSDEYHAYQSAQGFGGHMGVGLLVDHGNGGDFYQAISTYDPLRPEYESPYLPPASSDPSNDSFAQGASRGLYFGQFTNPISQRTVVGAGGFGLLYSEAGNDTFDAGVFAQGVSFFQGLGILHSGSGSSVHQAKGYAQGSAFLWTAAALWDNGGNDTYIVGHSESDDGTTLFTSMSGGFNYSLSWLLELGGNDIYQAPNHSLATGVVNSYAYMIDFGGDDTYNALEVDGENKTLGRGYLSPAVPPGNAREQEPTRGVFVDNAGNDTYHARYEDMLSGQDATDRVDTPPANAAQWVRAGYPNNPAIDFRSGEQGVGRDQP